MHYTNTMHFLDTHGARPAFPTWDELILSLFIRNLFLVETSLNGPMWTIRVEIKFYLLVCLFLPLLKNKPAWFYTGLCVLYLILYILEFYVKPTLQSNIDIKDMGQEGRHRAFAAIEAGIDIIPVVLMV